MDPAMLGGARLESLPNRERPPLPDFLQDNAPVELPPLPPEPRPPLSSLVSFRIERIVLTGNTVFSEADLASITTPYEGREVSASELQTLRHQLTLAYVARGYVNSGAVIPKQQVENGVLTIQIIEGRLTGVEITGNDRLKKEYIQNRLQQGLSTPLNMNELGRNVLSMHDGPLIKRIQARLRPGDKLGEGVLYAEVEEKNPWQLTLLGANDRSPSTGSVRLESYLAHHNLTGWGDTLDLKGNLTEGVEEVETSYSRPLSADDTSCRLWYSKGNAAVVESPFDEFDISSKTQTYGLTLNHPFGKQISPRWDLGVTLEYRLGESFLLGEPISFLGVGSGRVHDTALRLTQGFVLRRANRVLALRQMLSAGIAGLGQENDELGLNENFQTWLTQAQWSERLNEQGAQLLARADMQLANGPLLYLEKFAMGGASKVRGYRENLLVRDNGIIASLEFRLPVGKLPLPGLSRKAEDGQVQLAPFVDWGRSWNSATPSAEEREIASIGVGLRWEPTPRLQAQIYVAHHLNDDGIDQAEHDLQDSGIHCKLTYQAL